MNSYPVVDIMFTVVPIFMTMGLVLFVVLVILRATGRSKPSRSMRDWDQGQPYNPLLDPGNPASPHYPHQDSITPIDHNPSAPDAGGHHSGSFDVGGHSGGGGHH